jgi:hypothetical protein
MQESTHVVLSYTEDIVPVGAAIDEQRKDSNDGLSPLLRNAA